MSSSTATRTPSRTQCPARELAPASAKAAPRRVLAPRGTGVIGRSDRPVLRIVADDERAPVITRVAPARWSSEVETTWVETTDLEPTRVCLEEFFAVDGEDQQLKMTPRTTVRLTRRGRLVVFVASVAAVLGLGLAAASGSAASDHPERTRVVVVGTGQTLWDISTSVAGGGDVRATMSHIEDLNHLDSSALQAGQHLRVPVS